MGNAKRLQEASGECNGRQNRHKRRRTAVQCTDVLIKITARAFKKIKRSPQPLTLTQGVGVTNHLGLALATLSRHANEEQIIVMKVARAVCRDIGLEPESEGLTGDMIGHAGIIAFVNRRLKPRTDRELGRSE